MAVYGPGCAVIVREAENSEDEEDIDMNDTIGGTLGSAVQRLAMLASQNEPLRDVLRQIGEEIVQLTIAPRPATPELAVQPSVAVPAAEVQTLVAETAVEHSALNSERLLALACAPKVELPRVPRVTTDIPDLEKIEADCRLKAEAARWALARQRLLTNGAQYRTDIVPNDREIIAKAKDVGCFLWMIAPGAPIPHDLRYWDDVAGCFDAASLAVVVLRKVLADDKTFHGFTQPALDLAAEAQSALRMAVQMVSDEPDSDQQTMYWWLRDFAAAERMYIPHFMKIDDPADPTEWRSLLERMRRLDSQIEDVRKREKNRKELLRKGGYHAGTIREGTGTDRDWSKVIDVVDALVLDGVPPSNVGLREMIAPIVHDVPEITLPPSFERVLVEIDRYLTTQASTTPASTRELSNEVEEVARLYEGKTMVMVGGDARPKAHEALRSAFRLKKLIWLTSRDGQSHQDFVPYIARPDVVAVLLAIRWVSHTYGELRKVCGRNGKEFFRLPGGYGPNQVAHQILKQRKKERE